MLKTTSKTVSVNASRRFRRPWSVAKYQPKRTSMTSPMKNVSAGVMAEGGMRKTETGKSFLSTFFQHCGDCRFFHLDLHVIGHFYDYGCVFYVGDEPVNAPVCHHAIASL